jgi:uncharacterized protein
MLAVPVFAAPRNGVYILDELEHLDDDDFRSLHQEAIRVSEALGLDVILVFTYEENLEAYGQQLTIGQIDDQIIMLDNEEDWAIVCHGAAVKMTTSSDWDTLRRAYEEEVTYASAVEAYYATAEELLADREHPEEEYPEQMGSLVVDQAGLLTEAERTQLTEKLNGISHEHRMDVVLVTADDLGGKSPRDYADDFYDYNGYGYGENDDGFIVVFNTGEGDGNRNLWISTHGKGIDLLTDMEIDVIIEMMITPIKNGDFAGAFDNFVSECENAVDTSVSLLAIPLAIAIGFGLAFLIVKIQASKLKTVVQKADAADYVGNVVLTYQNDQFMYRNVTSSPKVKSDSSSTHTSSSGRTHGGGGRSF